VHPLCAAQDLGFYAQQRADVAVAEAMERVVMSQTAIARVVVSTVLSAVRVCWHESEG
jgi:hypothetical protein